MNTKRWLIASILWVLSLISLPSSAQPINISLVFRGDTISVDTAVVMDVSTYRSIRERLALLQARDSLHVELDANAEAIILSIQAKNEHLLQVIEELYVMLNRREVVIDNLTYSIRKLEAINLESIDNFEAYTTAQKKSWKSPYTWAALGIGVVVGVMIGK